VAKNYNADLYQENLELARLLNERERIDVEIAKKRLRIAALLTLTDGEEGDQKVGMQLGGVTEAVLTAFRSASPKPITAVEVRDRLEKLGFPIKDYRNGLAVIHTVISRLYDARKIAPQKNEKGETAFAYVLRPQERFNLSHTKGK
jgi:hypothetical protein